MSQPAPMNEFGIKPPSRPGMMVSYIDVPKIESAWQGTNFGIYADNLSL